MRIRGAGRGLLSACAIVVLAGFASSAPAGAQTAHDRKFNGMVKRIKGGYFDLKFFADLRRLHVKTSFYRPYGKNWVDGVRAERLAQKGSA